MAGIDPRERGERLLKQQVGQRVAPTTTSSPPSRSIGRPAPAAVNRRIQATSTGKYARPSAPPREQPGIIPSVGGGPAPDINSFLGADTGYQQQLSQYMKVLQDFMADTTRRKGSLESEYGLSEKAMKDQRGIDLDRLEDDFGARNLIHSGLYGKAVGDYESEFGKRMSDLQRKQQEALAALLQEQNQFSSQTELQKQQAREAAIRRRSEQYGV